MKINLSQKQANYQRKYNIEKEQSVYLLQKSNDKKTYTQIAENIMDNQRNKRKYGAKPTAYFN